MRDGNEVGDAAMMARFVGLAVAGLALWYLIELGVMFVVRHLPHGG